MNQAFIPNSKLIIKTCYGYLEGNPGSSGSINKMFKSMRNKGAININDIIFTIITKVFIDDETS